MLTKCSPISQEGCWELLVEEAENIGDGDLGQRPKAETVFILFLFPFMRYLKTVLGLFRALQKPWNFFIYFKRILKYFKHSLLLAF